MSDAVTTVGASPGLSLSEIGTLIAQQEDVLGPLVSLGNDGTQTLLIFDLVSEPPAKAVVINAGDPPPNSGVVTSGKIFVSGQLKDVWAFRPL